MDNSLNERVAVVSGASSGIGNAIVRHLIAQGIRVVASARRRSPLKALEEEFNNETVRVVSVVGDIMKPKTIDKILNEASTKFSSEADIVIVNAGKGLSGSVLSSDPNQWEDLIRLNLLSCLRMIRSAGERQLSQINENSLCDKAFDIVIIGSNVGRHISPFSSVYGSTKFAVHSLAEALRRELGPKGIRVSLIEPGIVKSGFQDAARYDPKWFDDFSKRIGPILEPDDIARLVLFIINQPPHVHINDVVIRPTRQDYP